MKSEIPIPIPRYFAIPNTVPTFKNTEKNTEYRYRLKIPIPTQLYLTVLKYKAGSKLNTRIFDSDQTKSRQDKTTKVDGHK